jgi:hypothetical protein
METKTGMGSRVRPDMEATAGQWIYFGCECHVRLSTSLKVVFNYRCAACGNTSLRFIHTLEHLETKEQIYVGIECAGILTDDFELPRAAEQEVKRKEGWRQHYKRPGRCYVTVEELIAKGKI